MDELPGDEMEAGLQRRVIHWKDAIETVERLVYGAADHADI